MRAPEVDGNVMPIYIHLPLTFPVRQNVQFVVFDSISLPPSQTWNFCENEVLGVAVKSLGVEEGEEGGQRAAYDARTSTSGWKKAVGVFVRRAAQTDRVKAFWKCSPRATENTPSWPCGQKMSVEAAFGVSPGEKGEQICPSQPTRSHLCCQRVTAGGEGKIKKEEDR